MIEITPAIIGPGIEEEYADALTAIADLRRALGERRLTNDTPDGRLLLEVSWVEQEIKRGRLAIPVSRSYAGTIYYVAGSGELDKFSGVIISLGRLYYVLKGYGLIKDRHIPVLISMIEDLFTDASNFWNDLNTQEQEIMHDMQAQAEIIRNSEWPPYRPPQHQFFRYDTPNLNRLVPNFGNRTRGVAASLFEGRRPYPARKPPLAAPVAGLPENAPPLPPELEGRLP